ncbi:MAG: hypothetical protein GY909_05140 [Oligoflexia bacterium]|nr:hypothetical protein [Oligoflexia bacterium]
MEKVIYYLNENYEKCLGSNTIIEKPFSIWDELFLWIEKPEMTLKTSRKFSKDFLDYIRFYIGKVPTISNKGEAQPWWGSYDDFDLAKEINSKEFSYDLAQKLKLGVEGSSILKGSAIPFKYNYICKNIFSFSGIDTVHLKEESDLKKLKDNVTYLFEPYLPKVFEFGHTSLSNGDSYTYENIVDRSSQYKGSLIYESEEFDKIEQKLAPAIDEIRAKGWNDIIQIDSLKYKSGEEDKYYYLMEINARKSMGLMSNLLKKSLEFHSGCNALFIVNKKKLDQKSFEQVKEVLKDDLWQRGEREGIVITSDFTQPFVHFFLGADNKKKIQYLFHRSWKKMSKQPLPIEFVIEF